jgi:hypothetical protein
MSRPDARMVAERTLIRAAISAVGLAKATVVALAWLESAGPTAGVIRHEKVSAPLDAVPAGGRRVHPRSAFGPAAPSGQGVSRELRAYARSGRHARRADRHPDVESE